ncbi:MAG: TatD family deoxyribonuclease [Chloroflexi bacterium]|nr:TatD family deoxyribonuclease [Chloroflexota bacterium]
MLKVIDTHAHLDEMENLESALSKAKDAGVTAIVAVGSNHESNQKTMEICLKYPSFVYPALGLHPWGLGNVESNQIDRTIKFIEGRTTDITAIGEIGLDYDKRVVKMAPKELQKEVMKRLLALAREYKKPAIIHSRYAWRDSFELVKAAGIKKAVFHWFTGFSSVLKDILDAGYFISATPAAEYHEEHRRAIKETPLDRLLLETDCPVTYGREVKYRSEPADILRSLRAVAAIKGSGEVAIAEQTTHNATRFFGLASTQIS